MHVRIRSLRDAEAVGSSPTGTIFYSLIGIAFDFQTLILFFFIINENKKEVNIYGRIETRCIKNKWL